MDWKKIISELLFMGDTEKGLGDMFGSTQQNISNLKTGKTPEPRYALGDALIKYHKRVMRRKG